MSRLIVVSNRVPDAATPLAGGLAVAMRAALEERGGIWMGWSGKSCGSEEPGPLRLQKRGRITYALSDLNDRDYQEYYQGFANGALWPLCHYRLGLTEFARKDIAGYYRVNRLFAERLRQIAEPEDLIWVQDYHFLPLGAELRARGVTGRIGFFMHIPWPAPDVFLTLPGAGRLLRDMTAYDVIGFQTEHDAQNFALCLERSLTLHRRGDELICGERRFRTGCYPISIDTAAFTRRAAQAVGEPVLRRLRDTLPGQKLVVGVDRLDYSKGIPQRIEAFRRFLSDNPSRAGAVSYLQITPKSRSGVEQYDLLEREIATLAGQLAGDWGRLDWTPMRYVNRAFGQNVLAGLYRQAEVALVTPLRDGMNLVAKEYVASQDPENPGVLILSRFAGAAVELGTGALLVNPYDQEAMSQALAEALDMPLEERRLRHAAMMAPLRAHSIYDWCRSFLADLAGPPVAVDCLSA